MRTSIAAALGLTLLMLPLPPTAYASTAATKTIAEVAADAGIFERLLAAAKSSGLDDELAGAGPLTVFAPSDQAFDALPRGTLEMLMLPESRDELVAVVSYHIIAGSLLSEQLEGDRQSLATLGGQQLMIDGKGSDLRIGDAKVVSADVRASNGVIHIIDKVMMPKL